MVFFYFELSDQKHKFEICFGFFLGNIFLRYLQWYFILIILIKYVLIMISQSLRTQL